MERTRSQNSTYPSVYAYDITRESLSAAWAQGSSGKSIVAGFLKSGTIVDHVQTKNRAIHPCRHSKSEGPDFKDLTTWLVDRDYGIMTSSIREWVPGGLVERANARSAGQAILNAQGLSSQGMTQVSLNGNFQVVSHPPIASPADRSAELPELVMQRINGWSGMVTLGELHELPELARMFTNRGSLWKLLKNPPWREVQDWSGATKNWKTQFGYRRFLRWLGEARNAELARRFGLNPTVGDVRSLLREMSRHKPKSWNTTVVLSDTKSIDGSNAVNTTGIRGIREDHSESQLIVGCDVKLKKHAPLVGSPLLEAWRKYAGMNPARSMWDLVPASFMVDYFLQIGSWIDALWLQNNPYVEAVYWKTTKRTSIVRYGLEVNIDFCHPPHGYWDTPRYRYEYVAMPQLESKLTDYNRVIVPPPDGLSFVTPRMASFSQLCSVFLVTLGFLPRK